MRIVSGDFKGRYFSPPKNFKARPTTDYAKESLFNIINNHFDFEEVSVLDLFSGTGSISFEFASRGCQNIHLVEMNPQHFAFIKKVIAELKLNQILALKQNAFHFLEISKATYDIIFADPPYEMKGFAKIPEIVFNKQLLNPNGWLIVEHSKNTDLSKLPNFGEVRNYGSVHFSFFYK
ncbi:MAG TPA: 16S rRNA (guanine(966)-N(2))-methyltransferase RsmD [Tenuifilaceae bacterium]|nr:16S rRNA (guanine(966)-N(2))-methyltransferase RsmD [Tenuifilaceae bacterium]HPE18323.1 16S rRNA (guanine(966)-N(2))-methyltransferase RsmD [Tenuifilaceae bacterium]HPJ45981.1 16S rRNA (guanine(966)-N(2))-methyltransferase RsmD [Tenuifilaceae bacterium]HPQ34360.1 16S rRNA (guanine(966)-N(2))-methyltransferase RsmD [Tenuifilaceae bacterium]HRX68302.1 16S rRNA (guanine(966)-N(2))-methyltransferase RsmD [Tenuifilaceae bacterium]